VIRMISTRMALDISNVKAASWMKYFIRSINVVLHEVFKTCGSTFFVRLHRVKDKCAKRIFYKATMRKEEMERMLIVSSEWRLVKVEKNRAIFKPVRKPSGAVDA